MTYLHLPCPSFFVPTTATERTDDALNTLEHALVPDLDDRDRHDLEAAARLIRRTLRRMQDRHATPGVNAGEAP